MIRHPFFCSLSLFFFLFISGAYIQAQTDLQFFGERDEVVWTGNTSDNWDDPANWSNTVVPDQYTIIVIPSFPSGGNFPVIYAETIADCGHLTISAGAVLRIRGFLTVHGQLDNLDEEAALIILSDETGTGSLIFSSENVKATVQRYLSDSVNHFIGASVDGATARDLYFNNDPEVFLYQYNENTGNWTTINNPDTPLVPGKGYSVYVVSQAKTDVTAEFKGVLKASDVHLSGDLLTYTEGSPYPGYNLISNPFSSALSWDLGHWQAEKVTGCIWLWNGSYNYLFRNAHGMGSLEGGVVPVSQAFLVKASGSNPSLTLSAADRVHSSQNFYKSAGRDGEQYFVLEVNSEQDQKDEVWVAFGSGGTDGYDVGWDTEKLFGNAGSPQLYMMENGSKYSVDVLPLLAGEEERTLSMDFMAGETGRFTISLKEMQTSDKEGFHILLKDLQTNSEQLLSQNPDYQFNADADDPPGRFQVKVSRSPDGIAGINPAEKYRIWSSGKKVMVEVPDSFQEEQRTIQITDLTGRVLIKREFAGSNKIVLPLMVNNTYVIIRLWDDKTIVTKKLFIQ